MGPVRCKHRKPLYMQPTLTEHGHTRRHHQLTLSPTCTSTRLETSSLEEAPCCRLIAIAFIMSSSGDATVPATRRLRKSIGGQISSAKATEKENVTLDLGSSSLAANRKKSRSKSIGPGGLDVLKNANGNRRAVCAMLPVAS